jgi:hypothetical protein
MDSLKCLLVTMACGALLIAASVMMAPHPAGADFDTGYDVTCYIGNPNNNKNIGTITIFDLTAAGASCNATFINCQGKCVGCVNDFDLDGTVCYDNNGKKFLQ